MPINCTFGEEIQTTSAEQWSSYIEGHASANSDGLDVSALQEYMVQSSERTSQRSEAWTQTTKVFKWHRNKSYTRSTMAQGRLQGLAWSWSAFVSYPSNLACNYTSRPNYIKWLWQSENESKEYVCKTHN